MTISIGSRAPSAAELVTRVAEMMIDFVAMPVMFRYADKNILKENATKGASLNKEVKDSMGNLSFRVPIDLVIFNKVRGFWQSISKYRTCILWSS
jgi:hypothetical protein